MAGVEAGTADLVAQVHGSRISSQSQDALVDGLPKIALNDSRLFRDDLADSSSVPIAIAVNPIALITTECITVTSAMRKHARWAQSSVSAILGGSGYRNGNTSNSVPKVPKAPSRRTSSRLSISEASISNEDDALANRWGLRGKRGKSLQDNPLMSAFARLRSDIKECRGTSLAQCDGASLTLIRYQNI